MSQGVYFPVANWEKTHLVSTKSHADEDDCCPPGSLHLLGIHVSELLRNYSRAHHMSVGNRWHRAEGKALFEFWEKQFHCSLHVTTTAGDILCWGLFLYTEKAGIKFSLGWILSGKMMCLNYIVIKSYK